MLDKDRIAFNAFWWGGLDSQAKVTAVCEDLATLGYRGVEWKETCFSGEGEIAARLSMAVSASRSAGLEVTDLVILRNLGDTERSKDTIREMSEFIRGAAAAGVKLVNTASAPVARRSATPDEWWEPAGPDWKASWDALERVLAAVLTTAEKEGVVIALEAIAGSLVFDYYSTRELLRRLQCPSLAVTMDPSHYLIHGNDVAWAIRELGAHIKHVHIKDALGRPGVLGQDFLFPLLGEGALNWREFTAALDDIGYDGWLSLEFESFKYMNSVLQGDALEAARLSMRSYRALCQQVWPGA